MTLHNKVHSHEIHKVLNVEPLLRIFGDPSYVGLAICPEWPGKDWRGKSCWQHPRESSQEVIQGLGGVITPPTLLGPVLVLSQ